jgi:hypothetical protein
MVRVLALAVLLVPLLSWPASAMQITVYHDGESCPGGCDSHVVFHRSHNGTAAASAPSGSRQVPQRCVVGETCRICFGAGDDTCMMARYRGGGPPPGKFDVTPAFLVEHCPSDQAPAALRALCTRLTNQAAQLSNRTYCLAAPDDPRCAPVMARARAAHDADRPLYERCRQMGEAAFNATQPPAMRRSLACAYELNGTGQNSQGVRWRRLLPGACPAPSFVGRDGLDCCTPELFASLAFGTRECSGFLLPPG